MEKSRQSAPVVLAFAVAGLGLSTAAAWTERSIGMGTPTHMLYYEKFWIIAVSFWFMWRFRNHLPSTRGLVRAVAATCVAYLALSAVARFATLPDAALPPLQLIYFACEGFSDAGFLMLFGHVLSSFEPKRSSVAIACAFLLNELVVALTLALPPDAVFVLRDACKIAGVSLLAYCVWALNAGVEGVRELQHGFSTPDDSVPAPIRFLLGRRDWAMLAIAAFVLPLLYGLAAQVAGGTVSNAGWLDVENEIATCVVLLCMVAFAAARGAEYDFLSVLFLTMPLYLTGFALLPLLWNASLPLAGILPKVGYTVITVLLWILLARKAYADPRHTYLYFGFYVGAAQPHYGRLLASVTVLQGPITSEVVLGMALACLWVLGMACLAFFLLALGRGGAGSQAELLPQAQAANPNEADAAPGTVAAGPAADAASVVPQPDEPIIDRFASQLDAFCRQVKLTEREEEVLREAVHGYSRKSIAEKLYLSPETVKTYLSRIYRKAGVSSKQALIQAIEKHPA